MRRGWVDRGASFTGRGEGRGGSTGGGGKAVEERDGAGRGGACALHLINLNPN